MSDGNIQAEKPPYPYIAKGLKEGTIVPFLGSYASLAGVSQDTENRLPDAVRLTELLSETFSYPDGSAKSNAPLTKVSQYVEDCAAGRSALYKTLKEWFFERQQDAEPPPVATFLADVDHLPMIVTTNYDPHVELAFRKVDKPFTVVSHITGRGHSKRGFLWLQHSDRSDTEIIKPIDFLLSQFRDRTVIYKSHGTFADSLSDQEDTIVVTENDYIDFIVMMANGGVPPAITRHLMQRPLLFLGYGLNDWNFRVVLRQVKDPFYFPRLDQQQPVDENKEPEASPPAESNFRSWAIQRRPPLVERRFWDKRQVGIYDVDLDQFLAELIQAVRNIGASSD